jgi:hypothetical protein
MQVRYVTTLEPDLEPEPRPNEPDRPGVPVPEISNPPLPRPGIPVPEIGNPQTQPATPMIPTPGPGPLPGGPYIENV